MVRIKRHILYKLVQQINHAVVHTSNPKDWAFSNLKDVQELISSKKLLSHNQFSVPTFTLHLRESLRDSFIFFLNSRNRDFGEKISSNRLSKWSSKYSHLVFQIFR
jgi:hypothetical protein